MGRKVGLDFYIAGRPWSSPDIAAIDGYGASQPVGRVVPPPEALWRDRLPSEAPSPEAIYRAAASPGYDASMSALIAGHGAGRW